MVETAKAAKKPGNRFDPRLVQGRVGEVESLLSRAVMHRPIQLGSLHAQRVVWRQFLSLRRSLFSISVILPLVFQDDDESIEAVEKIIASRFSEVRKTLTNSKAQLQKTLNSDGIEKLFPFNNTLNLNVAIDSPMASQYIDLVLVLDELVQYIETMWLSGNIDNKHRKVEVDKWEKALMRLSVSIIQEERRIKNAAKRKGIETSVADDNGLATNSDNLVEISEQSKKSKGDKQPQSEPVQEAVA